MLASRRIFNDIPSAVLAFLCAALGLAWIIEPAIAPASLSVRGVVLLAAGVLAATAWKLGSQRHAQQAKAAQRCLDVLCRLDPHRISDVGQIDCLKSLGPDNPWRGVFVRVRECLECFTTRLEEAELARAGADVRARRTSTERDQLFEILAGLGDPILAIGPYGELIHVNASAQRLLGLAECTGPVMDQLSRFSEIAGLLSEVRRRKAPFQRTIEISISDVAGKPRWYRITCRSLSQGVEPQECLDNTVAHGVVTVFTDITSHKAIQKRNAEFVSAASHEMKTPLSSIRAYVELLADGDAEDEQTRDEFFRVINTQVDRLQRLIENLLNLARIEAGVVNVDKQARSLNELLQEAVNVVQPSAEGKGIQLITEISPLYLSVLADRDTLLQAAINLLSNAIKYTRPEGKVTLRSRLNDQQVIFEVEDTGVGLSTDDCEKVFEKFYRVRKDEQMAPGTGLGLPLVKHIVEDIHAGKIEVVSALGMGSTFRVVLPSIGQLNA